MPTRRRRADRRSGDRGRQRRVLRRAASGGTDLRLRHDREHRVEPITAGSEDRTAVTVEMNPYRSDRMSWGGARFASTWMNVRSAALVRAMAGSYGTDRRCWSNRGRTGRRKGWAAGTADLAGREPAAAGRSGGGAVGVVPVAGRNRGRCRRRRCSWPAAPGTWSQTRAGWRRGVIRDRMNVMAVTEAGELSVAWVKLLLVTAPPASARYSMKSQVRPSVGVALPDEPVLHGTGVDQLHRVGLELLPGRRDRHVRLGQQVLAVVEEALVLEQRRAVDLALVAGALHQPRRELVPVAGGQVVRERDGELVRAELGGQITSPMNTSGVDEPPEIVVASVARLVSVSVGADTSDT